MELGLRLTRMTGRERREAAILSVLPWNGIYLSQLAYVGFFFIPVEIGVAAIILRKRSSLTTLHAIVLASMVRITVAGLVLLAIYWIRKGWIR